MMTKMANYSDLLRTLRIQMNSLRYTGNESLNRDSINAFKYVRLNLMENV